VAVIDIKGFRGIKPKLDPKFLASNQGQTADNCNLASGAMAPWRSPKKTKALAKTGDIKSIYYFDESLWLHWTEDVDVVRGPISGDTTERTYFTGTDAPRVTNSTLADAGSNEEYPEDSYIVGVPAPVNPITAALSGSHSSPADTAYVYTFVNIWGEESAPSPVSNIVAADFSTGSVDLTNLSQDFAGGDYVPVDKWRIYRIAVGATGAEYLFVTEITPNASSPQYNDAILNADLGEILPTEGWILPPASLKGLVMMGNGIMAGFDGNDIYFSEPFVPYAWPAKYSLISDYEVVGLGSYGNSLVVVTKYFPYIITGTTPESMSMDRLAYKQPGVSKRGIVSVAGGVIYPTPTGLFYIGDNGFIELTADHYTRKEWSLLIPNASFASFYDNKYIGYMPSVSKAICFDITTKELTTFTQKMSSLWSDPLEDKLYFVDTDDNNVYEFNAGGGKYIFESRSKKFSLKNRTLLSAAKVIADFSAQLTDEELAELLLEQEAAIAENTTKIAAGLTYGALNFSFLNEIDVNGDKLTHVPQVPVVADFIFQVYGDGALIYEDTVANDKPFRLPANKRYIDYEIVIFGQFPIQRVLLGSSIGDLVRG